jgi:hypothetical protein
MLSGRSIKPERQHHHACHESVITYILSSCYAAPLHCSLISLTLSQNNDTVTSFAQHSTQRESRCVTQT